MTAPREFYVGYLPSAPTGVAHTMRKTVIAAVVGAVVVAGTLVLAQSRFPVSAFEFGNPRALQGQIIDDPVPMLLVDRPGRTAAHGAVSRYLLTLPGKRGAESAVAGLDGYAVDLEGTLIYRDGTTMVEIVPGSVRERGTAPPVSTATRRYGRVTLQGEIADSKCFLGVMNPGSGKPHRACAVRCISGGAPPVLVVRASDGDYLTILIVDEGGRTVNRDVLAFVAEPVELQGELENAGGVWIVRADLSTLRRIA